MMDSVEHEVLSCMDFPRGHWLQIRSTNPLERLNAEIMRRTSVVGIFPSNRAITRLVGAMLLEQSDEWTPQRRHMHLEGLRRRSDTAQPRLSAVTRRESRVLRPLRAVNLHHARGHDPRSRRSPPGCAGRLVMPARC